MILWTICLILFSICLFLTVKSIILLFIVINNIILILLTMENFNEQIKIILKSTKMS